MLASYYRRKIDGAKGRLRKLSAEEARVKLDFKSLDIASEIENPVLYLNPMDEGLSVDLYAWGFREPINTHVLSNLISDEKGNIDAVIDVGSNLGYFPLVELASGASQVIAIEPVPETYRFLNKNLAGFRNAKALNVAVSDKKEVLRMYVPTKLNLATILKDAMSINVKTREARLKEIISVQALPLKEIIHVQNLEDANVFIRMDVEGFEESIIKGLTKEVYGLSFELHSYILGYRGAFGIIERLRKLGYKIRWMVRETRGLYPVAKMLGIRRALQLYRSVSGKSRVFYEPSLSLIRLTIREQRECPHIFAVKS